MDTNIQFPVANYVPPVKLTPREQITSNNIKQMRMRAARTTSNDQDKLFEIYYKQRASMTGFAARGYIYINNLLRSLTFVTQYHETKNDPKAKVDSKIASDVTTTINSTFIKSLPDSTILMDTQSKRVFFSFGDFDTYATGDYTKFKDHIDVLELFFNDIRLGTMAKVDENGQAAIPITMTSKGFIPLANVCKQKIPASLPTISEHLRPSTTEYPKEIVAIPEVKVEFVKANLHLYRGPMEKTVDISNRSIALEFKITIRLAFPLAYAYWATYAKTSASFSLPNFFNLIAGRVLYAGGKQRADQSVSRLMPMQTSMDILNERVTKLKLESTPRINRNRFTILGDGEVLYIPVDGDLKKYDQVIKESYDPETKKVTPLSSIPEARNQYLLSDWVHNVGVYTNTSGAVNTISFIGAMPFEDRFVYRYFRQREFGRAFSLKLEEYINLARDVCTRANITVENLTSEDSDLRVYDITMVFGRVLSMPATHAADYGDLFNQESEFYKELPDSDKEIIGLFVKLNKAIFKAMFSTRSVYSIINMMRFAVPFYIFGIAASYFKKYSEIYHKGREENKKNEVSYLEAMQAEIKLPNLPGATGGLLPHQGNGFLSTLIKAPKLVSIDVSAGGGKTLFMIIDMMNLLATGKIKRPIIMCPARLVSEWVSEVNKWSRGQLNPYPLTGHSVSKLNKYMGYDRQKLLKVIREAPINTIFIASYSFMKIADPFKDTTANTMQYGGTTINFFPNTQFVIQGHFDYCALDESHKLKNLGSQVSKSTRSVIGNMEHRRIASGTILFNTVDDIEGQVALLNPGIITDLMAARQEHSEVDNNGKTVSVDPRIADILGEEMEPYVSRMVYRRRDWAFLLPKTTFSFLQCDMTPNLKEYYNKKVDEKIKELLNDPELRKVLESEDQDKIDKVIKGLDTNFQKMEILLNCPDTDDAFRNLSTTSSKDLIPPKSRLVNQCISAHFNGGTVTDVTGVSVNFKGTSSKIIVFAYNKKVSIEIYKHLDPRYKGQFVHYSAGNEEAVVKFTQDPKIIGIVADETSIGTGFNFTMSSHIIRLQALWTPGAEEQAMARIQRADTDNKYDRKELFITQIMCRGSLDIAKTARNISKKVAGLIATEGQRPDWIRYMRTNPDLELPQIKMNLKLLKDKGNIESVGRYFNSYHAIIKWEYQESLEITEGLKEALATKLGIPKDEVKIDMLRDQGRTKFASPSVLPNSASMWTPLVPKAAILDKFGLGLKQLAVVKAGSDEDADEDRESEDDDNEDLEDNIAYAEGDMVVTEFGFGFIRNLRQGRIGTKNEGKNTSVNVEIPGFQKYYPGKDYVNLSLLEVFKPTNEELAAKIEKKLRKLAEKNMGILFVKDGVHALKLEDIISKVSPVDVKPTKPIKPVAPAITPPKHPGADSDFDPNDIVPADRTGKKPRNNRDDDEDEVAPPPPGVKPPIKLPTPPAPPKDTNTRKRVQTIPDDDVEVKKPPKNSGPPLPPSLDEQNRNKILNLFHKDPNKLYHYQKQTDTHSVVIDPAVINGEIALVTYPGEENFEALEGASPDRWYKVAPFVFIKVKTLQGASNLCDHLENDFTLIPGTTDRIMKLAKAMQSKARPKVEQNQKMDFTSLKNFILVNHTPPTTKNGLKVYPAVYDGYLYVMASVPTQRQSIARLMSYHIPGCNPGELNRPISGYCFFRSKNAAIAGLNEIARELHVVNYSQVKNDLETKAIYQTFVGR